MKKIISLLLAICVVLPLTLTGCKKEVINVNNMIKAYGEYDSTGERYDCYLPDYMEIPDFTTFEVPNITYTVTAEMLEAQIKRAQAPLSSSDSDQAGQPAGEYDIVEIVTECWYEGEILSGYTFTSKKSIVLGVYELDVPEIDNQIMGMNPGDTKKFDFTFPDPFYRDLSKSGKTATIEVTLQTLSHIKYDEPTDEFFYYHYGYDYDGYKAFIKTKLEGQYNEYIETYKSDLVWEYLEANTVIKSYPEERDNFYSQLYDDYRKAAIDADMTLLEYVKKRENCNSIEEFNEFLNDYVDDYCKREMILYFVARAFNLQYTQEYYEAELMEYVEDFEIDNLEDAESFIEFQIGLDEYKERIQLNYVYEWIGNNAPVAEDVTTFVNNLNK